MLLETTIYKFDGKKLFKSLILQLDCFNEVEQSLSVQPFVKCSEIENFWHAEMLCISLRVQSEQFINKL